MNHHSLTLIMAAFYIMLFEMPSYGAPPSYEVVQIQSGDITPHDINNQGKVTGDFINGRSRRAFIWDRNSELMDIGVPPNYPTYYAYGYSINELNEITGNSFGGGYYWSPVNGNTYLDRIYGWRVEGKALNSSGVVVGNRSSGIIGGDNAVVWDAVNGSRDFPYHEYANYKSYAADINEAGLIVGYAELVPSFDTGSPQAFIWDGGDQESNIIQVTPGGGLSRATAINDNNEVTGNISEDGIHAFFYTPLSGYVVIPYAKPDSIYATGIDLNDQGVVLVEEYNGSYEKTYSLWSSEMGSIEIINFIPAPEGVSYSISSVRGINNKWQIIGTMDINNTPYAVLLDPIINPPAVSLQVQADNSLSLQFTAESELYYKVLQSNNLVDWTDTGLRISDKTGLEALPLNPGETEKLFYKLEVYYGSE